MNQIVVSNLIGSSEIPGAAEMPIHEPSQNRVAHVLGIADKAIVDRAVRSAAEAFRAYGRAPAHKRSAILRKVSERIAEERREFSDLMVASSGKTRRDSLGEADRSAETVAVCAEEALRIEGFEVPMDSSPRGEGRIAIARRYPVGVLAAITPFNAPLNTVCHKIGPALAAGNTVVLKPDMRGARVALKLASLFREAGLPDGALNIIHGDAETGEALVTHPLVELVSFTGSEAVGDRITQIAGLKKVLLELGGNAPVIVHSDANLDAAVNAIAPAAFGMSGQSCISVQRVYVQRQVSESFIARLVEKARAMRMGPPEDETTEIGPMVTEAAAMRVEKAILGAAAAGARIACGGERKGAYLSPTVLTEVSLEMEAVGREIFGPVVSVLPYDSIDEAIEQSNATPYGLQAGLFTDSLTIMRRAASELRFGGVIMNNASRWRLDHMPYGGVKRSGFGREGAKYAIEDMTELRMIVIG